MSINPPDGTPEESEPVSPPEPVIPPAPAPPQPYNQPPQYGQAPQYAQAPQYGQTPPAQPPQYGQPGQPGQPPQYGQPGQPPYGYAYPPSPQRSGMGDGAKIGIGSGIGCVSYIVALVLFMGTMSALSQAGGAAYFVFFGIPLLVGVGLLFARKTRGFGVGILIISAAAWLVVLGPCAGLLFA
ncbi:hypothetical protein RS84_03267 [Microbacterium hydrocarbonoxydans]|uniref:DUF4190 domain-containing protein n=1 Tax=Microbacterium hydrocarbonoxydans TaxID=273678 RepID=A0A0M2HQ65_9MICO|nr:hypothetical protein [Microbacterium hydrocarbonoxydans]KJL46627.1 hypothetical protein RS84_03267 [Microbacterium hydrocarbonoxydans]